MDRQLRVTSGRGSAPGPRLAFLDALRGVAVLLVLAQHVGELVSPAFAALTSSGLQLGQMGVMVFFLCSGFIIPASLERGPDPASRRHRLGAFWRGRVLRLYPLYWLSLAGALALTSLGRHTPAEDMSTGDWLANLTMIQGLTGTPDALTLYWTLTLEMVFYVAVSVLYLLGVHRHAVALSLAASAGCVGAALTSGPLLDRPAPLAVFCLATMFTGTVFHHWYAGAVRLRSLVGCTGVSLVAGLALLVPTVVAAPRTDGPSAVAMATAWLGAYAVFAVGTALRSRRMPGWVVRLGVISYSVYLVQALVLLAVPPLAHPVLTVVVWTGVVLAVSGSTHLIVERPMIALGRRLGRRLDRPTAPGDTTGTPSRSVLQQRVLVGP